MLSPALTDCDQCDDGECECPKCCGEGTGSPCTHCDKGVYTKFTLRRKRKVQHVTESYLVTASTIITEREKLFCGQLS